MPYRLAFAIQKFFSFGGLQRDMLRIALACSARGDEVHVVTSEWDRPQPDGLHVHLLPLSARTNHGRSREFGRAVLEFVRRESFDCLVGFNKQSGLDLYFCGDRCLAERLRERPIPLLRWLPRYRTFLDLEADVLGPTSDAELLVLSEPERERIVRHYATPAPRLHLLPPGIDRRRFPKIAAERRTALRRELGVADDGLMILMVGSSFRTKGVDRSIRALASLPAADRMRSKLVVVGAGNAAPFLRLARRLGIHDRVLFAGARDAVSELFRSADVLIHPARTENTGLTLLEGMLCGLPVLVTVNCGYAVHIERADAGLVCPQPFSQSELNRLLAQMVPAEARRRWNENGLAYCSRTDLYSMVERIVELITDRAARNRRAA